MQAGRLAGTETSKIAIALQMKDWFEMILKLVEFYNSSTAEIKRPNCSKIDGRIGRLANEASVWSSSVTVTVVEAFRKDPAVNNVFVGKKCPFYSTRSLQINKICYLQELKFWTVGAVAMNRVSNIADPGEWFWRTVCAISKILQSKTR